MSGLTHRQAELVDAIRRLTVAGVAPSLEELRIDLGLASKGGIVRLLIALRERGLVEWTANRARSVRLVEEDLSPTRLRHLTDDQLRRGAALIAAELSSREDGRVVPTFRNITSRLEKAPDTGVTA